MSATFESSGSVDAGFGGTFEKLVQTGAVAEVAGSAPESGRISLQVFDPRAGLPSAIDRTHSVSEFSMRRSMNGSVSKKVT